MQAESHYRCYKQTATKEGASMQMHKHSLITSYAVLKNKQSRRMQAKSHYHCCKQTAKVADILSTTVQVCMQVCCIQSSKQAPSWPRGPMPSKHHIHCTAAFEPVGLEAKNSLGFPGMVCFARRNVGTVLLSTANAF